eukprot:3902935-Rhodomonas_salina.2
MAPWKSAEATATSIVPCSADGMRRSFSNAPRHIMQTYKMDCLASKSCIIPHGSCRVLIRTTSLSTTLDSTNLAFRNPNTNPTAIRPSSVV